VQRRREIGDGGPVSQLATAPDGRRADGGVDRVEQRPVETLGLLAVAVDEQGADTFERVDGGLRGLHGRQGGVEIGQRGRRYLRGAGAAGVEHGDHVQDPARDGCDVLGTRRRRLCHAW